MTVGSDVKNCYFAIKNAEASLRLLQIKSTNKDAKIAFQQAEKLITEVKQDLHKQVLFISQEETQYK